MSGVFTVAFQLFAVYELFLWAIYATLMDPLANVWQLCKNADSLMILYHLWLDIVAYNSSGLVPAWCTAMQCFRFAEVPSAKIAHAIDGGDHDHLGSICSLCEIN